MRKFIVRLLLFISPVIIFLAIITCILWQTKENFYDVNDLLKTKEKYLIGYAYNESDYGYMKWFCLNTNEKKTIWSLGSSRVLQFREKMFDSSFYNAGFTILSVNDFKPFLESIPEGKHPDYLIISLDQWMFNYAYDSLTVTPAVGSWGNNFKFSPNLLVTYRAVYKDLIARKFSLKVLHQNNSYRIGINAVFGNTGFRNDGSVYDGRQIAQLVKNDPKADDYKYSDTYLRIKQGNRRFEYGDSVNEKAIQTLDKFLTYCKNHQIHVVAFLPPYADGVYNKMMEINKYNYIKKIYPKVKPLFDKYQYEVYDISTVSSCNSNDNETIDGFHGGEATYQKLLIKILSAGSILNHVTNVERLKADLLLKKNNYTVYEY